MHAALGELAPTNTSESFWPLLEGHTCDGRLMAKIRSGKPITPTQAFGALGDTPQLLEKMFPSAP
ncbi:MAG: hypothetical protein HY901_37740 [Deltaproteobacteria bacterium]|nr:hypothetical protein [Deltaproteobacteria bacterium]